MAGNALHLTNSEPKVCPVCDGDFAIFAWGVAYYEGNLSGIGFKGFAPKEESI